MQPRISLFSISLLLTATTAQSDEISAPASITRLEYHSVLTQYQPYREQVLIPWRESNETVAKIGGWRVYAKEARQASVPQTQPDASHGAAHE
ncbi:hypothetical protein [Iodobacter sp.]|uniref:hypothetical protein n=1 Tax=Iodobacter sp. TaxID=1915058 RepID=UPI0025E77BD0|nr:hypothetical protein [Iodobacter sp.]